MTEESSRRDNGERVGYSTVMTEQPTTLLVDAARRGTARSSGRESPSSNQSLPAGRVDWPANSRLLGCCERNATRTCDGGRGDMYSSMASRDRFRPRVH